MGLTKPRATQIYDIDYKQATRVITLTNITLTGGAPSTVDGVGLSVGDRVLVAGQSTGSQNGLYYVSTLGSGSNGTWARSTDTNETGELDAGTIVMVTEGAIYHDTQWKLTTNNPIVIGTTALTFEQNSAFAFGNVYANGTAVLATTVGDTLTVTAGNNISIIGNASAKSVTIDVAQAISVTGNITGGNLITGGTFSAASLNATGNITGSNLVINNDAVITGNLTVNGTTTTINSNVIATNDKSITLANNQSTASNVDGAGIDVGNATVAYWRFNNATTSWQSNVGLTPAANATLNLGGASNYWATAFVNQATVATTVSAVGNITGGNLLTSGLISATGNITSAANITGGNISTSGTMTTTGASQAASYSATGSITGGNILTAGQLTSSVATGTAPLVITSTTLVPNLYVARANVSDYDVVTTATTGTYYPQMVNAVSGNVQAYANSNMFFNAATGALQTTIVSATGNVIGGNLTTGGLISATGAITGANITGANLLTGGLVSATGTITSAANITGANLVTAGNITAVGNIHTSGYFIGNGSQLTGVGGGGGGGASITNGTSNIGVAFSANATVGIGGILTATFGPDSLTLSGTTTPGFYTQVKNVAISTTQTLPANRVIMSIAPFDVNNGVVVTVPDSSTLIVLA